MSDPTHALRAPMANVDEARQVLDGVAALLAQQRLVMRPPPAEPGSCCGRGCHGCVWEGWLDAARWWREDAAALLGTDPAHPSPA